MYCSGELELHNGIGRACSPADYSLAVELLCLTGRHEGERNLPPKCYPVRPAVRRRSFGLVKEDSSRAPALLSALIYRSITEFFSRARRLRRGAPGTRWKLQRRVALSGARADSPSS